MLTKMSEDGLDYDAVLEDAQERGYAERNPAADVEGHDARRKIAILSSLAFGKYVDYEDVYTEGITKITSADFAYAKVLGSRIKLFGTSKKKEDGSISAMVCPVMITNEHPLFAVNDVMNAILVRGESMGDLMFYGAGAGKLPTASAVVADVVNAARNPKITEIAPYEPGKMTVSDHLKSTHSYFVRVKGSDANAVAESFKAKQIVDAGIADEFGLITAEWAENEFDALCENYPVVSVIRLAKIRMIMDHKNKDHAERTEDVLFCIIVAGIIIFVGGLGILHVLDLEWIAQGAPCFIYSLTGWLLPRLRRYTSSKGASLWQAV